MKFKISTLIGAAAFATVALSPAGATKFVTANGSSDYTDAKSFGKLSRQAYDALSFSHILNFSNSISLNGIKVSSSLPFAETNLSGKSTITLALGSLTTFSYTNPLNTGSALGVQFSNPFNQYKFNYSANGLSGQSTSSFFGAASARTVSFTIRDLSFPLSFSGLTTAVPEPITWMMMIGGIGLIGGMMRRAHQKSQRDFTRKVRGMANA